MIRSVGSHGHCGTVYVYYCRTLDLETLDLRRVFFAPVSLDPTGCRSARTKRGEAGLP